MDDPSDGPSAYNSAESSGSVNDLIGRADAVRQALDFHTKFGKRISGVFLALFDHPVVAVEDESA